MFKLSVIKYTKRHTTGAELFTLNYKKKPSLTVWTGQTTGNTISIFCFYTKSKRKGYLESE